MPSCCMKLVAHPSGGRNRLNSSNGCAGRGGGGQCPGRVGSLLSACRLQDMTRPTNPRIIPCFLISATHIAIRYRTPAEPRSFTICDDKIHHDRLDQHLKRIEERPLLGRCWTRYIGQWEVPGDDLVPEAKFVKS